MRSPPVVRDGIHPGRCRSARREEVSSTTNDVCRLESSVIVNRIVTVRPVWAVRVEDFWVYVALVPTFE